MSPARLNNKKRRRLRPALFAAVDQGLCVASYSAALLSREIVFHPIVITQHFRHFSTPYYVGRGLERDSP